MKSLGTLLGFTIAMLALSGLTDHAQARVTIAPYVSIKSTKSVKPQKQDKSKETETVKQRQEYGLRGSISFWRLMSFGLSVGQNQLTTTEKVQYAKDEYGEIDYTKDLNMSTDDPDKEIKVTETQRNAKATLTIDPGFWIFMLRGKVGVTATQRILEAEEVGKDKKTITTGPTYKPHSGFGFGVRLTPRMYFMAEYNMFHYKFPEIQPFEREVAVTYAVSI